jgi:hypothetical protein
MGFRFQRRVRILPGVRLNFSTRGTSLSLGPRGADVNFGRHGATVNVGIPGTGLRWTQKVCPTSRNASPNSCLPSCETCGGDGTVPRELPHLALVAFLVFCAVVFIGLAI